MLGLEATILVAFLSIFVPGVLLSFALLKKTELHAFEITVIGIIFGLIGPPTLTWLESYLMNYIHFFTYSLTLFAVNVLLLTVVGAVLCYKEGIFKDFMAFAAGKSKTHAIEKEVVVEDARQILSMMPRGEAIVRKHIDEEKALHSKQQEEMRLASGLSKDEKDKIAALHAEDQNRLLEEHMREEQLLLKDIQPAAPAAPAQGGKGNKMLVVWSILLIIMLLSFATRMFNIGVAPKFFEFDPYFDMFNTESILTFGYQVLLSPSAWPGVVAGTVLRVEPLIPYLEAYWYDLANVLGPHYTTFSTNLLSYTSSFYPPITAALLVFVVFQLLYHEYDEKIGLIGAALAMMMPVLFTTFVAGEQLLEPWGIFALFFFLASYLLSVRNPKDKRLAILAGIAFASNFLGAHYYTVTAGILAAYIVLQGIISITRKENLKDFYTSNAIVLAVIILFYIVYNPYSSTLSNRIPSLLGIPVIVAFPLFSLLFVAVAEYLSNMFAPKIAEVIGNAGAYSRAMSRALIILAIVIVATAVMLLTPLGGPLKSYLNLSARFTTPSKPLFMTVQEYIPTGPLYNFGAQGFGTIGSNLFGVPLLIWLVSAASIILLAISIIYRRNRTGILYMAIAVPLLFAGFSEVKYLPHLGVAYIIMFCIVLGEVMYLAQDGFKLKMRSAYDEAGHISSNFYKEHAALADLLLMAGVFFIFGAQISIFMLAFLTLCHYYQKKPLSIYAWAFVAAVFLFALGSLFLFGSLMAFLISALISIVVLLYVAMNCHSQKNKLSSYATMAFIVAILLVPLSFPKYGGMFVYGENGSIIDSVAALAVYSANPATACNNLSNGNSLGQSLFCNTIPQYWLNAMSWIKTNINTNAPRVLSWWDYGDWINWFGNANAFLRGDNAVAAEDYAAAANLVLGQGYNYTPQQLSRFMNSNQTKYLLLDQDLISKWQALNFLACVNVNATSEAFALAQGAQQGVPYLLGSSQCELNNDPQYALVPLSVFVPNVTQQSISDYCSISSSNSIYAKGYLVVGDSISNNTICINPSPNKNGVINVYDNNGTKMHAVIQSSYYLGVVNFSGTPFVEFLMIYLPGANGTVENAPSGFYTSNFYDGFMLGKLSGFTQVYPATNATGINMVNGTYPVRIFALNNYTGGLPPVPPKPAWVHNNYTMP
jgi:hypothetical protein